MMNIWRTYLESRALSGEKMVVKTLKTIFREMF